MEIHFLNNTMVCVPYAKFLSTVFLCSEFKLENIYSGVKCCGKNVRAN